jgi:signal transduction histidine kinase
MPIATFDPEGLHRAILNVVTNAIDACSEREHGRVVVTTSHSPDQTIFRVVVDDNGGGIAAEDLAGIFTPFASTKGSRGTGLGLPVSQKILKEHGGQILVESTPGVGSRFTLEFPASISDSAVYKTISEVPPVD